jgi:hypothetical protein
LTDFCDQTIDDFDITDEGLTACAIDDSAVTNNERACVCHEKM